jgi:excisionase family DNA binding protein
MATHGGLGHGAPHTIDAAEEDGMKVEERLWSPEEVAERLGMSRSTIGEWLRSGRLKGRRIGRFWRVKESDLQAFMDNPPPLPRHPQGAQPTPEAKAYAQAPTLRVAGGGPNAQDS